MLIMVEKSVRGGISQSIYRYAKANQKYMKDYHKNKELSYLQQSQKLPVNSFEWIEDNSQYNEDFIKNYNSESDEGYILKVEVQNPEKIHDLRNNLPFLPGKMKTEKVEKLVAS